MKKRALPLSGVGLALLLVVCGATGTTGSSDDGQTFRDSGNPFLRLGGPAEISLRSVPPVHDAIWPRIPNFL